jgi:prepilin-type N-terminal cleavage/methylation domain-containing protein
MRYSRKRDSGFTLIELMIVIAIIAILAAILVPNLVRAKSRSQLTGCQSNLRNLGNALEMYNVDAQGRYPLAFGDLTPNYMKTIPLCPAAGSDTYSPSYLPSQLPDSYQISCNGNNHQGFSPPGYPQFDSIRGLVTR